jgi:hypothetical protein
VRVRQRHPDLLAVVLEAEHLLHPVDGRQLGGPLGPHVDDQPGALRAQIGEDTVVVAGEADHLAAAEARPELGQRSPRRGGGHVALDAGGE